ncbi:hypothetical protein RI543_004528 [Arxiozyma heterogenica]|uniref:Major facilitator superfamily (MFS) profile domain-containing protein n=1 Tax=Arxiozyma heterogenica TaxID=278026 RepID=A0AAN7ZRK6_9SACH|nr:hypothetical protein RI543_004528 [Kazachstania heterogenica]
MLLFSTTGRFSKQIFNKHKRQEDSQDVISDKQSGDTESKGTDFNHHYHPNFQNTKTFQEGPSSGFVLTQVGDDATILTKSSESTIVHKETLKIIDTHPDLFSDGHNYDNASLLFDEDKEFPEGGLKAYSVVFGSFMGLIPVFGLINSIGAIESYISKNQLASVGSSTVSWIFSIYLSIGFFSCILAGGYFDRNGSKRLLMIGTILYVGGIFALADCKALWQFILAFSVLTGLGTGILMTPLVSVIATWFNRKRAMATSVATAGGSVGGIFMPPMLRKLYTQVGFQWAIRILAFICLACLLFSVVLCRERQKPIVNSLDSIWDTIKWYFNSSFNIRYFAEPKFLFTAFGMSLVEISLTTSLTFIASYSLEMGNSVTTSYNIIMASNIVGILGRYIPGYVADKWMGRFNIMITTNFVCFILNLVIWLPFGKHVIALWIYICLYGFFSGSVLSMTPVCIGQISRTDDFGKRYATAYCLQAFLIIPAIPIGGAIIGNGSKVGYDNFIIYVSMIMLAGTLCFSLTRYFCVGMKLAKF